jgi:hypothetical protein
MTDENLDRANELKKEIRELECFIQGARMLWTGKIIKQDTKYIFKANGYGAIKSKEFNMNTKIKNKVLDVLSDYLEDLKQELKDI